MKKPIKLRLTKIAAKTCEGYFSHCGCLVATSLKRRFPGVTVDVGGLSITLGGEGYRLSGADASRVNKAYDRGASQPISLDKFKPFTIELFPL